MSTALNIHNMNWTMERLREAREESPEAEKKIVVCKLCEGENKTPEFDGDFCYDCHREVYRWINVFRPIVDALHEYQSLVLTS